MAELRYEDPTFRTDFDHWTHAGAPAELVALVSPLLRGNERGGNAQSRQDAEAFLHQQSLGGLMREPFDVADSYNAGMRLLSKHGAKIDRSVMDRYAPSDHAAERELDKQRPAPGAPAAPLAVTDTRPVRNSQPGAPLARPSDAELGIAPQGGRESVSYSDYGPRPFWEAQP